MKPKPLFASAHVVTKLSTASPVTHVMDEWHEPHGGLQSVVHQNPKEPGVMLHARLGASGLQLLRGTIAVCVPLEVLFALASEINPAFGAPADGKLTPAEIQELSAIKP